MNANSATPTNAAVAELTEAVARLSLRVESLEMRTAVAEMPAIDEQTSRAIVAVQTATEALFGQGAVIEQRQDPEIDEQYFVVRAKADGTLDGIAHRYREWHRKLADWVPGREPHFRLAVEIIDEK